VKTIAIVGISPKDNRPSYFVFKYFLERGKRMIPGQSPGRPASQILGQKVYAGSPISRAGDMVDIFRASEFVMPVVHEALALKLLPQGDLIATRHPQRRGAALAEAAGVKCDEPAARR